MPYLCLARYLIISFLNPTDMGRLLSKTAFLLISVLLAIGVQSQQTERPHVNKDKRGPSLSGGFQVVAPRGEFAEYYDGTPVGLGGSFLFNDRQSPFEFGIGYSWQSMGKTDESIRVLEGEDINGSPVYGSGEMRVNSNIYTYHLLARIRPIAGRVQFYLDGIAGFKAFTTKTTILADNGSYSEVVSEDRTARDVAASFGWAAGLQFGVTRDLFIEGRVESLQGGKTSFVDPTSVKIDKDGNMDFNSVKSPTNVLVFQLGLSIHF